MSLFGWIVLAIGCFLSRTLRLLPAMALALMSGLMIGVLKGSTWTSVVEVAGPAAVQPMMLSATVSGAGSTAPDATDRAIDA
jgi:hypothetical protein